jgi:hypothetical protein
MKKSFAQYVAEARKFLVAVAGVAGQLVAVGLIHGQALHWTQVVLAAVTALGVYGVSNATPAAVSANVAPATLAAEPATPAV